MWWINLVLICLTVSEKARFTENGPTDAHAMALALLTQSSRAKNSIKVFSAPLIPVTIDYRYVLCC